MELWVPIKDFDGYEVSSNGRIKNSKTGRILRTQINSRGYTQVCIRKNNKQYAQRVHRLVANSFYDTDREDLDVNHIDGNKNNNFIGNLELCTRKENIEHALNHDLMKPKRTRIMIIETGKVYNSISDCSRDIGGDHAQIRRCLNGKEKSCKGYHFKTVD